MNKLVKLKQIASVSDKTETSYKLTFPVYSNAAILFLKYLEIKRQHFREINFQNFSVLVDNSIPEHPVFKIKTNWVRETAQECEYFLKQNYSSSMTENIFKTIQ